MSTRPPFTGLLSLCQRSDCIAVLKAYIDESGMDGRGPELIVACAIADQPKWACLAADWHQWSAGFHAQTASQSRRERLAEIAGALIDSIVVVSLRDADYKKHVSHDVRSFVGGIYTYGLISTMNAALFHTAHSGSDVAYFIEPGARGYSNAFRIIADLYAFEDARKALRIGSFGPANSLADLPLHVADLAAHEVVTWVRQGKRADALSRPLWELQPKLHLYGSDRADLDQFDGMMSDLMSKIRHYKRNKKARARAIRRGFDGDLNSDQET